MQTTVIESHEAPSRGSFTRVSSHSELQRNIAAITRIEDGVVRNLLITQRYHDLSLALSGILGRENVNWATFATWASKTAGDSIRGEVVPRLLRALLEREGALERVLARLRRKVLGRDVSVPDSIFDVARDALARVQRQVAEGNLRVFAELAPIFAAFHETFADLNEPDEAAYAQFERDIAFKPGSADVDDGQDALKTAFRAYYECAFERDSVLKAQKMLLANALIGLHEQTRLQPNIQGALDAPIRQVVEARAIRRLPQFLPTRVRGPFESVARAVARPIVRVATRIWERAATEVMMAIGLPGGRLLPLGRDVPPGIGGFPEPLRKLSHPPLLELFHEYDSRLSSTIGSGADDWANLTQRMRFIVELFRVSQQDQTLYDRPFSEAQRAAFEAGRLPEGPL